MKTLAYFGKAAGFAGKTVAAAYTKIYGDRQIDNQQKTVYSR
jgi:hypothetical protein